MICTRGIIELIIIRVDTTTVYLLLQNSMKRTCVGIWNCNKCKKTIAGGAWVPRCVLCCYKLYTNVLDQFIFQS